MSWPVDPLTLTALDPGSTSRPGPIQVPLKGGEKKEKKPKTPWKSTLFLVLWNSKIFLHSSDSTFVVSRAQGTALSGWICQCPHSPNQKVRKEGNWNNWNCQAPHVELDVKHLPNLQGSIDKLSLFCKGDEAAKQVGELAMSSIGMAMAMAMAGNIAACWIVWNCNLLRRAYWSQAAQPTMSRHMGQLAVQASRFFYIFHII